LVPAWTVRAGNAAAFERTDWLAAVFWFVHASAERAFEARHGAIFSYAARLIGWDARLWERAWANRIALFLRRWAARHHGVEATALFGPLPKAELLLTHDVDAVTKTWALRVKQSAFHGFNAVRALARGDLARARDKLGAAIRFAGTGGPLWYLDDIAAMARAHGLTSQYFVYGRPPRPKSARLRLIDPAYDIASPRLSSAVAALRAGGSGVGLHQSFDSWCDASRMQAERERVERALDAPVTSCRQHWLRFSWRETWEAQASAGLTLDMSLGFNDRPGFRNSAALRTRPWSERRNETLALESVPLILMDSHLHDYAEYSPEQREYELRRWIDEVVAVGGVASVLWHPHVIGPEYGWRPALERLLIILAEHAK
jgi:hypothetical protein